MFVLPDIVQKLHTQLLCTGGTGRFDDKKRTTKVLEAIIFLRGKFFDWARNVNFSLVCACFIATQKTRNLEKTKQNINIIPVRTVYWKFKQK
jgi:hypothetical protein